MWFDGPHQAVIPVQLKFSYSAHGLQSPGSPSTNTLQSACSVCPYMICTFSPISRDCPSADSSAEPRLRPQVTATLAARTDLTTEVDNALPRHSTVRIIRRVRELQCQSACGACQIGRDRPVAPSTGENSHCYST